MVLKSTPLRAEPDLLMLALARLDIALLMMEPIINLEEMPGKIVGKIKRRTFAEALDWMAAQVEAMGLKLPYPKGVYRFKTHEETNQWEWNHMMQAALKKFRERQTRKT